MKERTPWTPEKKSSYHDRLYLFNYCDVILEWLDG